MMRVSKDKEKNMQDKLQNILTDLLKEDDNKYCADCDGKGPRWASWNIGIFLCIRCAGIHRNLGVHISRVKSINLDSWTTEQVAMMQEMGNSKAQHVYEATLPSNFRRPQVDSALETFIRAKYEHRKYILQDWVPPKPTLKMPKSEEKKKMVVMSPVTIPSKSVPLSTLVEKSIKTEDGSASKNEVNLLGLETPFMSNETFAASNFNTTPVSTSAQLLASTETPAGKTSVGSDLFADFVSAETPKATNPIVTSFSKDSIMALYNTPSQKSGMTSGINPNGFMPSNNFNMTSHGYNMGNSSFTSSGSGIQQAASIPTYGNINPQYNAPAQTCFGNSFGQPFSASADHTAVLANQGAFQSAQISNGTAQMQSQFSNLTFGQNHANLHVPPVGSPYSTQTIPQQRNDLPTQLTQGSGQFWNVNPNSSTFPNVWR